MAGLLGLSVAVADAAMVERAISVDVCEAARDRYTGAPARHGAPQAMGQREIEGIGGRAWYEGA